MNHDHRDRKYKSGEFKSTEVISVQFFSGLFYSQKNITQELKRPFRTFLLVFVQPRLSFFNLSKEVSLHVG